MNPLTIFPKKISLAEISSFAGLLAKAIASGVPVIDAVKNIGERSMNPSFTRVLGKVQGCLEKGHPLSQALKQQTSVFPRTLIDFVKAGEKGGCLAQLLLAYTRTLLPQPDNPPTQDVDRSRIRLIAHVGLPFLTMLVSVFPVMRDLFSHMGIDSFLKFLQICQILGFLWYGVKTLSDYFERPEDIDSRLRDSVHYPLIVFTIGALTILGLLAFVIPQFKEIFAGMRIDLPLGTQVLIFCSEMLSDWWFLVLQAVLLFPFAVTRFLASETGQFYFEKLVLRIPYFGEIFLKARLATFFNLSGEIISAGVDPKRACKIALEITQLPRTSGYLVCLGECLDGSNTSVIQASDLLKIAGTFEIQATDRAKKWVSLVEVGTILMMGFIIGGIVLSVFMPMSCHCCLSND